MNKTTKETIESLQEIQSKLAAASVALWSYGIVLTREERMQISRHLVEARRVVLDRLKPLLNLGKEDLNE